MKRHWMLNLNISSIANTTAIMPKRTKCDHISVSIADWAITKRQCSWIQYAHSHWLISNQIRNFALILSYKIHTVDRVDLIFFNVIPMYKLIDCNQSHSITHYRNEQTVNDKSHSRFNDQYKIENGKMAKWQNRKMRHSQIGNGTDCNIPWGRPILSCPLTMGIEPILGVNGV